MQSGLKKTKDWIVEFEFDSTLKKDVLMGWNSSGNTEKQVKLSFINLDDAINWCNNNNFTYRVVEQSIKKIKKLKKDLFKIRIKKINCQVENPALYNTIKKSIARLNTNIKNKND